MASGLIHRDGQYEFNGILFNNDEAPVFLVTQCQGLHGTPDIRSNTVPAQAQHGSLEGFSYYQQRAVEMDISILASTKDQMSSALKKLATAMQLSRVDQELRFKRPGLQELMLYARPHTMVMPSNPDMAALTASGMVSFRASDPVIYSATWDTEVMLIAGGADDDQVTVVSESNWLEGVGPQLIIDGPTIDPVIYHDESGRSIMLDCTLLASDTLTIDLRTKTVVDQDGVSRNNYLLPDNQWWKLVPGSNTIQYSRTGTSGDSGCIVRWRDGFLI